MPHSTSNAALFVLIAFASYSAPARAVESKATVEKVLAYYHTEDSLDDSLSYVEASLDRRKKEVTIPAEQVDRILSLARRIYRKKNLYGVFKEAYRKNTTLENMTALYNWQLTVKGIKLRQGFNKVYDDTPKAWKAYFDKESPSSLKPNRKNAITTFVTTSELFETQVRKAIGGELAVMMALNSLSPKDGRDSIKIIKERVAKRRPSMVEPAREQYMTMAFFMLRELKNSDIDELTAFSATPNGQVAIKAYLKALELTFDSAAATLSAQILKGTK